MAKKSRTPPPPRRPVQAPRARSSRSEGGGAGTRRLLLVALAAIAVAALAAVVVFVVAARGGPSGIAETLKDGGCTFQAFRSQGRRHVDALPPGFEYNSFPPTSGPHHGQPAIWGSYDEPVEPIRLVHNLEHGGVVVQYGRLVPRATVDRIIEWYLDDPTALVVAPVPALGRRVTLAAWTDRRRSGEPGGTRPGGRLATCRGFDEDAFSAFRDAYRYRGPERIPAELLQPGM